MNLSRSLSVPLNHIFRSWLKLRRLLPKEKCRAFGAPDSDGRRRIEKVYVINLDRGLDRWAEIERELSHVVDASGRELASFTERFSAVDARIIAENVTTRADVIPFYTLEDQLFVEPQPRAFPDRLQLDQPILMTPQEIAVARSHIGVWQRIAAGEEEYSLVLEDDVWFQFGFARYLEKAWEELSSHDQRKDPFDVLYLSYNEVKHGAQKSLLSEHIFCPVRGLWFMSGYVLSRDGAAKILRRLPCRGPVDLWMNHQFQALSVRAIRRSRIGQRPDCESTNSYSILPALSRIGAIDSENASLFRIRPTIRPVFAFGPKNSGLSSLAMALSMLGYRCCSDLRELPECEHGKLLTGSADRTFDAYVNVGSLAEHVRELSKLYTCAKFIFTTSEDDEANHIPMGVIAGINISVVVLKSGEANKWRVLSENLNCAPPVCAFPKISDVGQRRVIDVGTSSHRSTNARNLKRDRSPWVIESNRIWNGLMIVPEDCEQQSGEAHVSTKDFRKDPIDEQWFLRDDTFSGNLGLFRRSNVKFRPGCGAEMIVRKEPLGVRDYSAASISSCNRFLFGRFEAEIRPANVPGLITGFFLHRDTPRQEIDIEIAGNRTDRLLANVFYNPGGEGARYDYGYRGAPTELALGFDASKATHRFAIEWYPNEIRWLIDGQLVHRRVSWNPTPIPLLPMTLHVNIWPSGSKELAGRLNARLLPATTVVESIFIDALSVKAECSQASDSNASESAVRNAVKV